MRRLCILALLVLAPTAWADAPAFVRAKQLFDEAVAAERRAVLDARRQLRDLEAAYRDVDQAAEKAVAAATLDVRRLDAIEASIEAKFKAYLADSADVVKLRSEARLLRKWFDEITAGKTRAPVALRMAGIQLQQLAAVGVIGTPRRTSFSSAHDLRRSLAEVKGRLTAAVATEAGRKQRLKSEIDALSKRLATAFEAMLDPTQNRVQTSDKAMLALLTAATQAGDKQMAVLQARRQVHKTHGSLMKAAGSYTPPILDEVVLHAGKQEIYTAKWYTDGKAADVRRVDELIEATRQKLAVVRAEIGEMERERQETRAARLQKAIQMHRLAKVLDAYAQEYRTVVIGEADAKFVVDVCVAVVSFVATGGTATLAQAADRFVGELEKKAVNPANLTRALPRGTPDRVYRMLLRHLNETAEAPLKRLSSKGLRAQFIREYVYAAEIAARAEGRSVEQAATAAGREAQAALVQMQSTLEANRRGFQTLITEAKQVADQARPRMPLKSAGRIGRGAFLRATAGGRWASPKNLDAETLRIVAGDALAGGTSSVGGMYLNQRLKTPDLSRWKSLKQTLKPKNFKSNLRGQGAGMLITAAGTGMKVYITRSFGEQANKAITRFWELWGQLAVLQAMYAREVEYDRKVFLALAHARKQQALLENDLVTLQKPRTLRTSAPGYIWDPESEITARLVFSNIVTRPPLVSLGGVQLAVAAHGDARTTRVWIATGPAKKLKPGHVTLRVALAPKTEPFEWLDADPAKRAYLFIPITRGWRDWQKGADEHHVVEADFDIARALEGLASYGPALQEHAKRGNDLYGAGPGRGTGWNGMDASVRKAHQKVGAPVRGDPNGQWWMAGNKLGLSHSGAQTLRGAVHRYADVLRHLAWSGKKMGASERAYYDAAIKALYRWHKTRESWYRAAQLWLERKALYGLIGAVKDHTKRERLQKENRAAVAKIEQQLRDLMPKLREFKR